MCLHRHHQICCWTSPNLSSTMSNNFHLSIFKQLFSISINISIALFISSFLLSIQLTSQSIAIPAVILISLARTTLPPQNFTRYVTALSTSSQELRKSLTNIKPPELHYKVSPPIASLTTLNLYTLLLLGLFHSPPYKLSYATLIPNSSNYTSSFIYSFISVTLNDSTIYHSNYIKCLFITSYL